MSYNGSGTFAINTAGNPVVSGTAISSTSFNATMQELAVGLTNAMTRDGQSPATANIPMGGNKITGLAAGTAATDAVNLGQLTTSFNLGQSNIVINGGFTVNQRAYASSAVLASGAYGHDRWKAGAGGGDYSFTQLSSNTIITIAANKTLIQVVENVNVQETSYVLSWTGTAQARYAVNSATPSGSYAASPILITGQTEGTTMSIEFGNGASSGTLGKVQLERGATASNFEQRPYGMELFLCQRYYRYRIMSGIAGSATSIGCAIDTLGMRAYPSLEIYGDALNKLTPGSIRSSNTGTVSARLNTLISYGGASGIAFFYNITGWNPAISAGAAFDFGVELVAEL